MYRVITVIVIATAAWACSSSKAAPDAMVFLDAAPDAFVSECGNPGDPGNEQGVGFFCTKQADCNNEPDAPLCSVIGDKTTHFCTHICQSTGSGSNCGTGATCTCDDTGTNCGCTPNTCL